MSRYDGLIIPRSYSEYINKTDAATLQQALQLSGVLSGAVAAGDNKAIKSDAVNTALANYTRKERYIIQPNETKNFTLEFGLWSDSIVIIYVNDPWRIAMYSCTLSGYMQDLMHTDPIVELSKNMKNNIVTVHNGNTYSVAICFEFK